MKTKIIASLILRCAKTRLAAAAVSMAGICLACPASAATTWYWTGKGGDANWFTAANWNTAADGSGNDATELASGDSFTFGADAPAEITYNPSAADFAVGSVTFASGAPSIVVKGDAIARISSVTNSSGLEQTFSNAVAFASTANVSGSSAASPVTFAGGATATKPASATCFSGNWTLTPGGTWQLGNNSYTALSGSHIVVIGSVEADNSDAKKNGRFTVNEGAKLEITGNFWARPSADDSWRAFQTINGTVDIKGSFEMSSWYGYWSGKYHNTAWGWPTIAADGNGTLAVGKTMSWTVPISGQKALSFGVKRLVCGKNWTWKLGTSNTVGLNFPNDFEFRAGGDFTLPGITGNQNGTLAGKSFHFNTTDFYDGETGRTIVISGTISSQKANSERGFSAFGNGTVVFNCDYTNFTGGFTASNGVRVVLASGKRPGQNPVTMKEGTTLAVTNSVTTGAIGGSGAVTLESGSALAFNFSSTTVAPIFAFNSGATLSLPAAGEEPVKVKVTADEGLEFDFGSAYTITSNGKFPDDAVASGKIALSEDSASWVSLSVASGNLVVTKKPFFHITVR